MTRVRRLLCIAALLASGSATADGLRLVMRDGWVVPLSADGTRLAGEPTQLDLPDAARTDTGGIYAVAPDYAARRLYVVVQAPYAQRGTAIYDLASMTRIGFMPGVLDVVVPADANTPTIYARTFAARDPASADSSVEYLMYENTRTVTRQLRDRRNPANVLAQNADDGWDVLGRCHVAKDGTYATSVPFAVADTKLAFHDLPAAKNMDQRMAALAQGSPVDCWPNGDRLLALPSDSPHQHEHLDFSKPLVARRSLDGEYRRIVGDNRTWSLRGRYALATLGRDGRYAALLSDSVTQLFDFAAQSVEPLRAIGNPYWAQRSADNDTLYLISLHYRSRGGATDALYIDGGSTRRLSDKLARVTIAGGTPHGEFVALPEALTSINQRLERIALIERLDNLGDEEKREQIAALPAAGPLADRIGRVEIVGVIAD